MTREFFVEEKGVTYSDDFQEEESSEVIIRDEQQPLFDLENVNHDIFVVPTQEGADKDDQWNGSIGDATMEHIYQQRHKMLELEHFIYTPNGNIFRTEFTVAPPDEDGQRGLKQQIIKVMTAREGKQGHDISTRTIRNVTPEDKENVIDYLKKEIEEAQVAKAEKQDAMDQVVVPFEDWESNPQMTNAIDIPSTPPVMYIYAGNASQMFYDWVAEDHPDLRRINSFLSMANAIDWDGFNDKTVDRFKGWLLGYDNARRGDWVVYSVAERLVKLCQDIAAETEMSPTELTVQALKDIEDEWFRIVAEQVTSKFKEDPVVMELLQFEKRLVANKSAGKLSWAELGKFGQTLYKKYSNRMSSAHWSLYKQLKKKYAPEVRIGKVDINHANMNDLRSVFKARFKKELDSLLDSDMTDNSVASATDKINNKIEHLARTVWLGAPYMTLEDLATTGLITIDDIGYTEKNVVLISLIKKAYNESLNFKKLSPLGRVAQQVIAHQRKNPTACTEQEWYAVWQSYRICKASASQKLDIKVDVKPQKQ